MASGSSRTFVLPRHQLENPRHEREPLLENVHRMAVMEYGRFSGDRFVTVVELKVTLPEVGVRFVLMPPERV